MGRSRRLRIRGTDLAILVIAALAFTCSGGPRRPLTGNGAILWRLGETRDPPPSRARGRDGDLALMSASVTTVVAGKGEDPRRTHREGSIVAATPRGADGAELEELRPIVRTRDGEIPVEVFKVRAAKRDDTPFVLVEARSEEAEIELVTRIELAPNAPAVRIETTISNTGHAAIPGLQMGDRVSWPDGLTFAPQRGFVAAPSSASASWVGRRGREASYALAFTVEAPTVEFEFEPHGPIGALALTSPAPLPPGASRTYRRSLVVVKGGLEGAAREAWTALGLDLARIRGTLSPIPAWATIDLRDAQDRPVIEADAAPDGTFDVWAPPGSYAVVSRSPGGEDRVAVKATADGIAQVALTPPTPGVLRFHVIDGAGLRIPARLVIRGVPPTADPRLGPRHLARGAENLVYTASGDGAVELPVGKYRVTSVHGPEFSISTQEITVSEGKGAVIRAELDREVETPGWIAADFHVHAEPSFDSSVSLEDRVTSFLTEGLDFAAATDHNVVTDYAPAVEQLGAAKSFGTARGVEVTTDDPQLGHFNVWPYPEGAPIPPFAGQTPRSIFDAVRAAAPGAILQVNHPRMMEYNIGYFGIEGLDPATGAAADPDYAADFDAVEIWNGMNNNDMAVTRANLAEWFDLLNAGYVYTATGGSDSHVLIYQWVGFPRNYVRVTAPGAPKAEDVAAAVRSGRVQVGAGPFITLTVAGQEPGDLVHAAPGRIPVEAEVRAASWVDVDSVEIWVNGELVAEGALGAPGPGARRGKLSLRLAVERDAFVVAVARGDAPMVEVLPWTKLAPFAFTNPVFIDVDGDGRYTPLKAREGDRSLDAGAAREEDAGHAR